MQKYQYDSGVGTPKYLDIDTYRQTFYSKEDEMIPIYGMGVHLGGLWGGGSNFVIDEEPKPVPEILKIGYYSYVENKFFEGEFILPSDKIEKYLQERKNIFETDVVNPKYNYFSIGVTLQGMIVLWIKGTEDQIEIGRFYANEVFYKNYSDIFDDERSQDEVYKGWFKNFDNDLKKKIVSNNLPYDLWETYREKYNLSYNTSKELVWFQIQMINMEKETYYGDSINKCVLQKERAIPYNLWFKWKDNGQLYEARIILAKDEKYYRAIYKAESTLTFPEDYREEEVFAIFQKIDKSIPVELFIKINQDNTHVLVYIRQDNKEYQIPNFTFKVFNI